MAFEDVQVVLRNRTSHTPVQMIDAWQSVSFTQNRYKSGPGQLQFIRGAVDRPLFQKLRSGDYSVSIYARLENGQEVHYYGFIDRVSLGSPTGGSVAYHLHDYANEIIGRGSGSAASQYILRTRDTHAQSEYTFHEMQNWQSSVSTEAVMQWKNNDKLMELERSRRESSPDFRVDAGLYNCTVHLQDQLGYLAYRFVDCTSVASRYGSTQQAATQLRDMYVKDMVSPTLSRRAIDIRCTASSTNFTSSENVREQVRWEKLSTVAEAIAIRSDLTLTHEFTAGTDAPTIAFGCKGPQDQRTTKPPITEMLSGEQVDAEIGDVRKRHIWIDALTQNEPVDSFDVVCERRDFSRQANGPWMVKTYFGNYRRSLWT